MRTSCCFRLSFISFWKDLCDRIVQFFRIELLQYLLPWFLSKNWFCIYSFVCVFKMYSIHSVSAGHQVARVLISYLDPVFLSVYLLFSLSLAECKLTARAIIKLKNSALFSTDLFCFELSCLPPYLWVVRNSFPDRNYSCSDFGLFDGLLPIGKRNSIILISSLEMSYY